MTSSPACELYIDGASRGNPGPASVGIFLKQGQDDSGYSYCRYLGETTNNVAEYFALIFGLEEAWRLGHRSVMVKTDSELLARQINGQYQVRDAQLRLLHNFSGYLIQHFKSCTVTHIPRELNTKADRLANQAIQEHFSKK